MTAPDGVEVTGKVKLVIKGTGKVFTAKLVDGKAVFELPKFTKVGTSPSSRLPRQRPADEGRQEVKVTVTK